GFKIDARAYANVVVVRVQKPPCGTAAIGAQHFEEIKVGVEPVGGVKRLRRARERDSVDVDATVLPFAGAARQLSFVDQLADKRESAQLRHERGIECDLVYPRQDFVLCLRQLLALRG